MAEQFQHPTPMPLRRRRATSADVQFALSENHTWEGLKRILYDRISIVAAGAVALANRQDTLFNSNRSASPANTNLLNAGAMGPNEKFVIQGIGIAINANSTAAVAKYLQEARLQLFVGPDLVEKVRIPLIFLPSPASMAIAGLPNGQAQVPTAFYRLQGAQQIVLNRGNIFQVLINLGVNAPALAAADVVDFYVQLFGTYYQPISRGQVG